MKTNLIIIGAGELGREAFNWASQAIAHGAPWQIKGFLDSRPNAVEGYDYAVEILSDVTHYEITENDVFISAIGDVGTKIKCCEPIHKRGGTFVNVIHPSANIGNNVELGTGILMAPFSSITCDAKIGNHVTIGSFSNAGHDTAIGDWCQISSHCGINGNVKIEKGAFLGSHTCLIPGVKVGEGAYVGAGSVVLKDVAAKMKVFGNPAIAVGKM